MRMRVLQLLPMSSMPLTVQLWPLVASALLLLLCSTSCLGSHHHECLSTDNNRCGSFNFSYPFGKINSGCGDPEFQLDCLPDDDGGHPVMNISGEKYHILEPDFLGLTGDINDNVMTVINDNLWWAKCNLSWAKCNLSGNYSQFWRFDSHFQIAEGYNKLMLSGLCNKSEEMSELGFLHLCGDDWYYNNQKPEEGIPSCQTHLQLPIEKEHLPIQKDHPTLQLWSGFEITWYVDLDRYKSCGACSMSYGTCGYNSSVHSSVQFLCYCPDGSTYPDRCPAPHGRKNRYPPNQTAPTSGRKNKHGIVIGCSVGGVALTAIALVLFFTYYAKRRKPSPSESPARDFNKYERKDWEACGPRLKIGNLSIFSYEELRQATNCFDEENELGDGGFGSVYLGKLWDERLVAVKRLYQDNSRRLAQFINEVAIFSTLNHPRVVCLYGCTSADSPELLLVYEFVSNGTLANHLHGDRRSLRGLPWDTRLNIAVQTAEALAFLHSVDPPIFHRDVKSSNILLDENFNVKVADFGLCRNVPVNVSHVTTTPQGTPGYVDPEYHQYYQLTEKSDVYSFGVVLVEIISAKLAVDINRNTREVNLANMAISKIQERALNELVDPQLEMEMNHKVKVTVSAVAELAFRCLASESDDRPHMKEAVAQLEVIRELWGVCPSPLGQSASLPTHKHWRSFPTSVQNKRPSMSSAPNASA